MVPVRQRVKEEKGPQGTLPKDLDRNGRFAQRALPWVGMILILLVAASLRFYHLGARGYIFPDERVYVRDAEELRSAIGGWTLSVGSKEQRRAQLERLAHLVQEVNTPYAKPMHNVLTALGASSFAGRESGVLYFQALLGLASLVVAFLVGRALVDGWTGLLFAGLLAISPFHLNYSRSALAQIGSLFFLLVFFLFYYVAADREAGKKLWLYAAAGLFLGLSLTVHYGVAPFFAGVLVWEGYQVARRRRPAKGLVLLFAASALPALLFESLFIVGRLYTFTSDLLSPSSSYLLAFLHSGLAGTHVGLVRNDLANPWFDPWRMVSVSEGPLFLFLLAGAALFVAWRRPRWWSVLYFALVPYLFWGLLLNSGLVARIYFPTVALGYLAIAAFLRSLPDVLLQRRMLRWATAGGVIVAVLFAASLALRAKEVLAHPSPYGEIVQHLKAQGIKRVLIRGRWFFFDGVESVDVRSWDEAVRLANQGVSPYLVVSEQFFMRGEAPFFLALNCGVIFSRPSAFNYLPYQFEGIPPDKLKLWQAHRPLKVKVLDLRQCHRDSSKTSNNRPGFKYK